MQHSEMVPLDSVDGATAAQVDVAGIHHGDQVDISFLKLDVGELKELMELRGMEAVNAIKDKHGNVHEICRKLYTSDNEGEQTFRSLPTIVLRWSMVLDAFARRHLAVTRTEWGTGRPADEKTEIRLQHHPSKTAKVVPAAGVGSNSRRDAHHPHSSGHYIARALLRRREPPMQYVSVLCVYEHISSV